jgi:glutamine amidotransferase
MLLGAVATRRSTFSYCLRDSPRSLVSHSKKHPDGWGAAFFQSPSWRLHKNIARAGADPLLDHAASQTGEVLVAHIRKRTVGTISPANTHPFVREEWAFAHNGTIEDCATLRRTVSSKRLREVEGDTDSELLFASLLTSMDDAGPDEGVPRAIARIRAAGVRGSYNFLLSDGASLSAYRFGRPLFMLHRSRGDLPHGAFVASAVLSPQEPWREIAEGKLVRIFRRSRLNGAGARTTPSPARSDRPTLPT